MCSIILAVPTMSNSNPLVAVRQRLHRSPNDGGAPPGTPKGLRHICSVLQGPWFPDTTELALLPEFSFDFKIERLFTDRVSPSSDAIDFGARPCGSLSSSRIVERCRDQTEGGVSNHLVRLSPSRAQSIDDVMTQPRRRR